MRSFEYTVLIYFVVDVSLLAWVLCFLFWCCLFFGLGVFLLLKTLISVQKECQNSMNQMS